MKVKKLSQSAVEPVRATSSSAGLDLCVDTDMPLIIVPGETLMFGTGLAMEIPEGYAGLIYPRSGLSTRRGIVLANSVAVIDSDYRGEIKLPLRNVGSEIVTIQPKERVAQMIITPYLPVTIDIVDDLSDTDRGAGGFGSTGRM